MTQTKSSRRKGVTPEPVVKREYGDGLRFVMSLSKDETVRFLYNGDFRYYRVRKLSKGKVTLQLHNVADVTVKDAFVSGDKSVHELMALGMEKVIVSPIGEVFPAHD